MSTYEGPQEEKLQEVIEAAELPYHEKLKKNIRNFWTDQYNRVDKVEARRRFVRDDYRKGANKYGR